MKTNLTKTINVQIEIISYELLFGHGLANKNIEEYLNINKSKNNDSNNQNNNINEVLKKDTKLKFPENYHI